MSAHRFLALIILIYCGPHCLWAEDVVYQRFLSLVDTNDTKPQEIISPSLVDTNNTLAKATASVLNVEKLRQQDGIAGLRLGMTMEQVVASWGKPIWFWSRCLDRLPTFTYKDAMLGFEANSLKVIRFGTGSGEGARFESGLNKKSSTQDWIRALGVPTVRKGSVNGCLLIYAGPRVIMTLQFHEGELTTIKLENPASVRTLRSEQEHQSESKGSAAEF